MTSLSAIFAALFLDTLIIILIAYALYYTKNPWVLVGMIFLEDPRKCNNE